MLVPGRQTLPRTKVDDPGSREFVLHARRTGAHFSRLHPRRRERAPVFYIRFGVFAAGWNCRAKGRVFVCFG